MFVLYGSKLEGILKQYVEARGVKDYDSLIALVHWARSITCMCCR